MTSDTDRIEREIEAERTALARSLDELQGRFSPEAIIDTATGYVRTHGGDVAGTFARQAKENPLALALTGAGLAWLIAGPARKRPLSLSKNPPFRDAPAPLPSDRAPVPVERTVVTSDDWDRPAPADRMSGGDFNRSASERRPKPAWDRTAHTPVQGFRDPIPRMAGFDDRLANVGGDDEEPSTWEKMTDMVRGARERAIGAWTDMTHSDPSDSRSFFDKLSEGTEHMSEMARERVVQARAAAWDAQRSLQARAGDYTAAGREAYGSQPLVGGLVAFGIGALIGATLPRTRKEDEYLGTYRDRAFDEAERIFGEESGKLRSVAEAAVTEAKAVATEALQGAKDGTPSGKEAVDKAEGAVKGAADRVKTAAEKEADKQNLGGSVT